MAVVTAALTKRSMLMTQESVTLKKIPGKEKPAGGQKTSFKHMSNIWLCFMTLVDGIIMHSAHASEFCTKITDCLWMKNGYKEYVVY